MKPVALGFCILLATFIAPRLRAGEQVFFGNLHSHTSYSDGSGTPSQAYKYARDTAKLDFLAITDHNHRLCETGAKDRADGKMIATSPDLYTGPRSSALIPSANRYTRPGRFVALVGQEFSTVSKGNHVNVFDIDAVIDDLQVPNGRFDQLLSWLQPHPDSTGQKPIIQFNHALDLDDYAIQYGADDFGTQAEWIARMGEQTALFEILNGPAMAKQPGNHPADIMEADYDHYLLLGFHVAPTGDQDNHYKTWGTATDARTGVIADELTKPGLLAAIRARHVYATEDKNLRLIFRVNDRLCGDILPAPETNAELQITYTIHDDDEVDAAYRIEVHSGTIGANAVHLADTVTTTGNTAVPGSIHDIHYEGGPQFVYFKVTQANEDGRPDRAWTAPVWFASPALIPPPTNCVASVHSAVYHVSPDCRYAKTIKAANLITGPAAMEGRTKHDDCPVP